MWTFFSENIVGSIAIIIMFYSIALQIEYLKFKRKSKEADGKIIEIIKKKFWQIARVEFTVDGVTRTGRSICFFNKKLQGAEVDLYYNPKMLELKDKSVVITPLLKKMGIKKESPSKTPVLMKQQNPSLMHLSLIFFALILLTFS